MDHLLPEENQAPPPGPDPDPGFYQRALARMPRWIALVTIVALPFVWWRGGSLWAASFVVGAIGGYWNYVGICRFAERLSQTSTRDGRRSGFSARSLIRLLFIAAAAFVIIRFTRINLAAAFMGLFTPAAAVVIENLYELGFTQEKS
jgi:hypothetical protein